MEENCDPKKFLKALDISRFKYWLAQRFFLVVFQIFISPNTVYKKLTLNSRLAGIFWFQYQLKRDGVLEGIMVRSLLPIRNFYLGLFINLKVFYYIIHIHKVKVSWKFFFYFVMKKVTKPKIYFTNLWFATGFNKNRNIIKCFCKQKN